jgi:hypothetical protein
MILVIAVQKADLGTFGLALQMEVSWKYLALRMLYNWLSGC